MRIVNPFRKLEYYKELDALPAWNWFKVQESGDVSYILLKKRKINGKETIELREAFTKLTNEYIDTFGISFEYKNVLMLQRDLRCLEIDYFITQNKIHLTFIEVKKRELKKLMGATQKADSMSVQVHVKKYMGGNIDFKVI